MNVETYRVVGAEGAWHIARNEEMGGDKTAMTYATKEAAFEAAVSAASNAIKAGRNVSIMVPGAEAGETSLGGTDWQELS
jgi:hypothetical protein